MTGREVGTGSTATGSPVTAETCSLRDLSNKVLTEYSATTGASGTRRWKKEYLYRNSTLLAVESTEAGSRSLQHFTVDHLGTPRLVMDRDRRRPRDSPLLGLWRGDGHPGRNREDALHGSRAGPAGRGVGG